MAENVSNPKAGYPLSDAELKKKMGDNPLYQFLKFQTRDRVHFFEDFLGDTINLDNFAVAAGATATTWAHSVHASGMIRGAAGTTAATSGLQIYTPAMYYGDQMAGCEVRLRTSVITEGRIEVGFASTLPAVNTNVVNNMSTPTFNTTANGAMYMYDHTGSTTTTGLYTIGTAITAAKTATTTKRYVADTFSTIRIQLITNQVELWIDGVLMVSHTTAGTNYIEGGTAASFFLSQKRSDTTDANIDIDYVRVWQNRL